MPFPTNVQTLQSAATATGNGTSMPVSGFWRFAFQVAGITIATVTFEGTIDGTNWVAIQATSYTSGTAATTATADGIYFVATNCVRAIRARISAYTSGTITVTGNASD
jgi:hypothetical protein